MNDDRYHANAPRSLEVLTGVILAIISPPFIFLFLYLPIAIYRNNTLSIGIILAEVILVVIGVGLPVLSYRLITGKGAKNGKSLFTVHALSIFGLFFGVASLATFGLGILIDDIKMILLSPFGLVMAFSIVKLSGKRKARTDGS